VTIEYQPTRRRTRTSTAARKASRRSREASALLAEPKEGGAAPSVQCLAPCDLHAHAHAVRSVCARERVYRGGQHVGYMCLKQVTQSRCHLLCPPRVVCAVRTARHAGRRPSARHRLPPAAAQCGENRDASTGSRCWRGPATAALKHPPLACTHPSPYTPRRDKVGPAGSANHWIWVSVVAFCDKAVSSLSVVAAGLASTSASTARRLVGRARSHCRSVRPLIYFILDALTYALTYAPRGAGRVVATGPLRR
jgi:hypothetical protein